MVYRTESSIAGSSDEDAKDSDQRDLREDGSSSALGGLSLALTFPAGRQKGAKCGNGPEVKSFLMAASIKNVGFRF